MPVSHMHKNEIKAIVLTYLFKNPLDSFSSKKIFFRCQIPTNCASIYNKAIAEIMALEYICLEDGKLRWNNDYFISKSLIFGRRFYAYYNKDKYRISISVGKYPLDEDVVVLKIKDRKRLEAELIDIVSRTQKRIVGTMAISAVNGMAFVVPDNYQRYPTDIFIGSGQSTDPLSYCKVEVQINKYETKRKPCGTVVRMIHNAIDHLDKHIPAMMARYGLKYDFNQSEIDAAAKIKKTISQNGYIGKPLLDDRKVFLISDKQFSDIAFAITRVDDTYELDICIPDVVSQIPEGSVLDQAALNRGFSIFHDKYHIPMIPDSATSNMMFAEAQKRLALVVRAIFDATGHIVTFEPFEAVICPQRRILSSDLDAYEEKPNDAFEVKYCDILDELLKIKGLFELQNTGYLLFEKSNTDLYSNKLISHFKNIYDSVAAYALHNIDIPLIYTACDEPDEFDLHRLVIQCESIGINIDETKNKLKSIEDVESIINNISDKKIKKAIMEQYKAAVPEEKYEAIPKRHHSLNAEYHCNVSSPCNRYADLFNQRIFKRYIRKTIMNEHVLNRLRVDVYEISEKLNHVRSAITEVKKELVGFSSSSVFEKSAKTAVSCVAYKITPSGVFAILDNGIHGLLKAENHTISDRIFEYEKEKKWEKILLGDYIKVKYDHYDIKSKRIIFKPI